jgi:hypothetical protein
VVSRRANIRKKPITPPPDGGGGGGTTEPATTATTGQLIAKQLDISGAFRFINGVAEIDGKGRFYLFKKDEQAALAKKEEYLWSPNVEVSLDIKVSKIIDYATDEKIFINIGGPTNHFTDVDGNSNGRNYSLVFRLDRNGLGFKKETIHGVYDEIHTKDEKMQLGKWYNIKFRQTVIPGLTDAIKLEGWVNGQSISVPFEDRGGMTEDTSLTGPLCSGDKDKALYYPIKEPKQVWIAGAYSGLYIRLTGTVKTWIKNLQIKEF